MKKRIASIALSLAMCLTLLPTAAYAEDVSEGDLKAKESFVKAVQRYLRTNDGKTLKIKTEDLQQFEKQLIESGL
mgnify:CR=1 FL=1